MNLITSIILLAASGSCMYYEGNSYSLYTSPMDNDEGPICNSIFARKLKSLGYSVDYIVNYFIKSGCPEEAEIYRSINSQ
jgi:hypothetical protein